MREPVKVQAQIQSSSLKLSNLYKYSFRCIVYFPGNNYLKIFFFFCICHRVSKKAQIEFAHKKNALVTYSWRHILRMNVGVVNSDIVRMG